MTDKYDQDREDRRMARAKGRKPNRRGDYQADNHGVRRDKWKNEHRKQLWRKKWLYIDAPDARHTFKDSARHTPGHSIGIRQWRTYEKRKAVGQVGFQPVIEHEKPKVPGRVLRDAQEEHLWMDEI